MVVLLFLNEALQLISVTTISGVFFGLNLALYFLCTQLFYQQYHKDPSGQRKSVILFLYNSLILLAVATELGCFTDLMRQAYIDHGGIHGEPLELQDSYFASSSGVHLLQIISTCAVGILAPFMQLWRTWVIWATSPYRLGVTILTSFLAISGISLTIFASLPTQSAPKIQRVYFVTGIAIATLTVVFNVFVTCLLVGRIAIVRRRHIRLLGTTSENGRQYTNIVAMLIESYALDAVWSTGSLICFALSTAGIPVQLSFIFNYASDQVTVLAFLLLNYRVLLGRAWTTETERQLSTLQWNRDDADTLSHEATAIGRLPRPVEQHTVVGDVSVLSRRE